MKKIYEDSVRYHRAHVGKLGTCSVAPVQDKHDLALAYTPGVAEPCRVIARDPKEAYNLTWKGRTVAVVSDGSAVLGLGNIGAQAGIPVMEGKSTSYERICRNRCYSIGD
jgi:malate dehydrogenase (oxaloacetate-decarboxylating)